MGWPSPVDPIGNEKVLVIGMGCEHRQDTSLGNVKLRRGNVKLCWEDRDGDGEDPAALLPSWGQFGTDSSVSAVLIWWPQDFRITESFFQPFSAFLKH